MILKSSTLMMCLYQYGENDIKRIGDVFQNKNYRNSCFSEISTINVFFCKCFDPNPKLRFEVWDKEIHEIDTSTYAHVFSTYERI